MQLQLRLAVVSLFGLQSLLRLAVVSFSAKAAAAQVLFADASAAPPGVGPRSPDAPPARRPEHDLTTLALPPASGTEAEVPPPPPPLSY